MKYLIVPTVIAIAAVIAAWQGLAWIVYGVSLTKIDLRIDKDHG